jgi:heat shock protein HslJ
MHRLATVLLLGIAACGGSHAGSASSGSVSVAQRVFVVRQISHDGTARNLIGHPSLRFDTTSFSVETGCNIIGGHYRVDGVHLLTSDTGGTTMACSILRTRQENDLAAALASPASLRVSGKELTITRLGTVIIAESNA